MGQGAGGGGARRLGAYLGLLRQLIGHQLQGAGLQQGHAIAGMAQQGSGFPIGSQPAAVGRGEGGLLRIGPGIQVEAQIEGQGLGEARLAGLGGPGEAEQQFGQLGGAWQGAEGVQTEPDLGLLELAQIAIGRLQPYLQSPVQQGGELQVLQQAGQAFP
jgi:hypothetical protein